MELTTSLKLADILESENVAELLTEAELAIIGSDCFEGYRADRESRSQWEEDYAKDIELAMQVVHEKTYPWQGASNIHYPLITNAALQYHARAYPATVPGEDVVGCMVLGEDPDNKRTERAMRVSAHMSYQCMEEDEQWEESHDKTLIVQPIIGCCFKKTYQHPVEDYPVSEIVFPKDLVVNYYTKSLKTCPRLTHVLEFSRNSVIERINAGKWLEEAADGEPQVNIHDGPIEASLQESQGLTPPPLGSTTPYQFGEQHRWLDLDGDGYEEPYIVTFRLDTQKIARIFPRFVKEGVKYGKPPKDGKPAPVKRIQPEQYFVKYPFIPAPDGCFYDQGFGSLLRGISHGVDSGLNQLLDSGHMKIAGGGFLAKGMKVEGGEYRFRPNEWKRVSSSGAALKDSIYPLPVGEPSEVMLKMITMLIDAAKQIGMSTDPMVGENPGQNQKVGTTEAVIEQGEKQFNAIFKRTYRAMKEEFKQRYRLNYLYPPVNGKYEYAKEDGQGGQAMAEDYFPSDKGIVPTADPNYTSQKAKIAMSTAIANRAYSVPGYNKQEAEVMLLKAMKAPNQAKLYPTGKGAIPPQPNPKVQVEQMKIQFQQAKLKQEYQQMLLSLQEEARLNDAKIAKMSAEAMKAKAEAKDKGDDHLAQMLDMAIDAATQHQNGIMSLMKLIQDGQHHDDEMRQGADGGMAQASGDGGGSQSD